VSTTETTWENYVSAAALDRALRLAALARERGAVPVLHPEGFAQLKLPVNRVPEGTLKLHVWDPRLPRAADDDTVHDHVWDMESRVLVGRMVNETFSARPTADGDWEMWEVAGDDRPGMGGTTIATTGERVRMVPNLRQTVPAGSGYSMPRFVLHRSLAEGVTATLMQKGARIHGAEPRVAARVGQTPDRTVTGGFEPPSPSALWLVISEAIGL
jgi:hypothetical protein